MGNSRWRLQTTLNYIADQVSALGREQDVEIVLLDWGSEVPLQSAIEIEPALAKLLRVVRVPPGIAVPLQRDSPFPEVLALNAAARRASGLFIGRIDQDTLIGKEFFDWFFAMTNTSLGQDKAVFFSNLRMVPYRLASRCPKRNVVKHYLEKFGRTLPIELFEKNLFYANGVGIFLVHRDAWHDCGGYDERMIYMNAMEIDMIKRLLKKYELTDLGRITNHCFYHLEHYHPLIPRMSALHRRVQKAQENPGEFHPNNSDWGLVGYDLEVDRPGANRPTATQEIGKPSFDTRMLMLHSQMKVDRVLFLLQRKWETLLRFNLVRRLRELIPREPIGKRACR